MERKTFSFKSFDFVWLDHLSWSVLNFQFGAVEMCQLEIDSKQGFS